jgi:hypothetical protein
MPAPYSETTYVGVSGVQVYTIGFPFLKASYLSVSVTPVGGSPSPATFTVINDLADVSISSPLIAGGETILIQRMTSLEARLVDWESPAALREDQMDLADDQFFHLLQELYDDLAGLTVIVNEQSLPPGGAAGDVLTKASAVDYDVFWTPPPGGGSGSGITGGLNVGGGEEVFRDVTGAALAFRTLVAGAGITITQVGDTLELESTAAGGGEVNTGSNVGVDGTGVFDGKVGADLQFRHIAALAGGGLQVDFDAGQNDIDISIATSGVTQTKIADGHVTLTKLADIAQHTLLGRFGAGSGVPQQLRASDLVLVTSAATADLLLLYKSTGELRAISPSDVLPPGSVGNPDLSQMPGNSLKGNAMGSAATPQDLIISSITTEAVPVTADFSIGFTASGNLRKFPLSALPSAGAAVSFVTIACPSGTNPVADLAADTLTLLAPGAVSVVGSAAADSVTLDLAANGVTNLHLADMAADRLKGRLSGSGDPQDIALADMTEVGVPAAGHKLLGYSGGALRVFDVGNLPSVGGGTVNAGANINVGGVGVFDSINADTLQFRGINAITLGGIQVTLDAGNAEIDLEIADGGVTNVKLANVGSSTLKGRTTAGTGTPQDLVETDFTTGVPSTTNTLIFWAGPNLRKATFQSIAPSLSLTESHLPNIGAWTIVGRNSSSTGSRQAFTVPGLALATPAGSDLVLGALASGELRHFTVSSLATGGIVAEDVFWATWHSQGARVVDFQNTSAQPGSPTNYDAYILPASPTGVNWSGQGNKVALFKDIWYFRSFTDGLHVHVKKSSTHHFAGVGAIWEATQGEWYPDIEIYSAVEHYTGKRSRETGGPLYRKSLFFNMSGAVSTVAAHGISGILTGDAQTTVKATMTAGSQCVQLPQNFSGFVVELKVNTTNVLVDSNPAVSSSFQVVATVEAAKA